MASLPSVTMRDRLATEYGWTARQRQVLEMLAGGKSNAQIAARLGITLPGAKWHVSEVLSKLQTSSREEAAEYWRRYRGWKPRYSRVFRAVASTVILKPAVLASVVTLGVGAVTALLVFRADEPPADDEVLVVAPLQVSDVVDCPVNAQICEFALDFHAALLDADFGGLRALMRPTTFTCPGAAPEGLGGPFPLCSGAMPGESRPGYAVHVFNSDGYTVVSEPLTPIRNAILNGRVGNESLVGIPEIRGIQCPLAGEEAACDDMFVLFMHHSPNFIVRSQSDGWRLEAIQMGDFAEDPSLLETGGEFAMVRDDRIVDGRFFPWRPEKVPVRSLADLKDDWLFAPSEVSGLAVEPMGGSCPAGLIVEVVEPEPSNPKGPQIAEARLYAEPYGTHVGTIDRNVPFQKATVRQVAPGRFELVPDQPLLGAQFCSGRSITILGSGSIGTLVAGYRLSP